MTSPLVRTIGVEIECLMPNRPNVDALRDIAPAHVHTHGDGSIDGDGEGIEVVLGPVTGEYAESLIRDVVAQMQAQRADVNASTGLHVHVDATEVAIQKHVRRMRGGEGPQAGETVLYVHQNLVGHLSSSEYGPLVADIVETERLLDAHGSYGAGKIVQAYGVNRWRISAADGGYMIPTDKQSEYYAYAINEQKVRSMHAVLFRATRFFAAVDPILRGLVPASRRHNTYCQPFEKVTGSGGAMPSTLAEVLKRTTTRYCGINLSAIEKHGTIECRYHNGSVNAEKIIHWARLWERCVNLALSDDAEVQADILCEIVNGKNRLEMLCAILDLPEETTAYLMKRHSAFAGSDARHTIKRIANIKQRRASEQMRAAGARERVNRMAREFADARAFEATNVVEMPVAIEVVEAPTEMCTDGDPHRYDEDGCCTGEGCYSLINNRD